MQLTLVAGKSSHSAAALYRVRNGSGMDGNVFEWCQDYWFGSYPGGSVTDPKGPESGSDRVARGGGRLDGDLFCRSAGRYGNDPDGWYGSGHVGFRLVLAPGQPGQ